MNSVIKSFEYGNQTVTLETGRIARQASGAVLVTMGKTSVLCAVVAAESMKPGQDFFPLSVHYQKKPTLPVKFLVASSSVKRAQVKRRR